MPLYRSDQEVINKTVQKHVRASNISFYNPLGGTPYVGISEEMVNIVDSDASVVNDDPFMRTLPGISMAMTPENATTPFNLLDPTTGNVIGSATYEQVFGTIYSLYFHLAGLRDSDMA